MNLLGRAPSKLPEREAMGCDCDAGAEAVPGERWGWRHMQAPPERRREARALHVHFARCCLREAAAREGRHLLLMAAEPWELRCRLLGLWRAAGEECGESGASAYLEDFAVRSCALAGRRALLIRLPHAEASGEAAWAAIVASPDDAGSCSYFTIELLGADAASVKAWPVDAPPICRAAFVWDGPPSGAWLQIERELSSI